LQVTLDELASLMYFVIGIVLIAIAASPRYRHLFVRKTKVKEGVTLVRRLTISSSGRSRARKEWDAAVASATHDAVDVVYMEKERRLQTAAAEETLEGHSDGNGTAAPLSHPLGAATRPCCRSCSRRTGRLSRCSRRWTTGSLKGSSSAPKWADGAPKWTSTRWPRSLYQVTPQARPQHEQQTTQLPAFQ